MFSSSNRSELAQLLPSSSSSSSLYIPRTTTLFPRLFTSALSLRMTLTGQNLTDLLDLEEGVLLRQDGAVVEAFMDLDFLTELHSSAAAEPSYSRWGLLLVLEAKIELRKLRIFRPGEMGCFVFFSSA
nr:hypothetical protein Itr_chr05CG19430 [Ipomoea trifida]